MAVKGATEERRLVLGLDVGTASVGWALLEEVAGQPQRIVGVGSRIFPEGLDRTRGEKSRSEDRRLARGARRLRERRVRRKTKLLNFLLRSGLLPTDPVERIAVWRTDPYSTRATGLDRRLEPHELGRALFHLAQRRGFKSNRKDGASAEKAKEQGDLKKAIGDLEKQIVDGCCRTLGEYLSRLDPHDKRRRTHKLSREMILSEFRSLWAAQQPHHPSILTDALKLAIENAIFDQRPLRAQKFLIGYCELLGHKHLKHRRRRAPKALLLSQRFRILQELNNLRIILPTGEQLPLDADQRDRLLDRLDRTEKLTFEQMRKLLKIEPDTCRFNLQNENRLALKGNLTAVKLRRIFGKTWDGLTAEQQEQVVEDCRSIDKDEVLARRGMRHWGLDEGSAERLSKVALEEGHGRLSRTAMRLLVPHLEAGASYADALAAVIESGGIVPPPRQQRPKLERHQRLRNPMVDRSLTEVRKVVNGLLREHGRPDLVRIELARDLKRTRLQRQEDVKKQAANSRENERATEALQEAGIPNPSRNDVIKWKLWKECRETCPYTGKPISFDALFRSSQFDIEHIIPWPRSLDDSYMNKTLCDIAENRDVKKDRTPFEAYGQSGSTYDSILQRVRCLPIPKRKRFETREIDEDFASRALNDTRYIAREAKAWLEEVMPDEHAVQVSTGQATAMVRRSLGLNNLLGDSGEKTRQDHRHHAVDALAVALTSPGMLHRMSRESSGRPGRPSLQAGELPWPDFRLDAQAAIDAIKVSHCATRKANGPLHDETFYAWTGLTNKRGQTVLAVRKPVSSLTASSMKDICDPAIRDIVNRHVAEHGGLGKEVDKLALPTRDGRRIPIRKVRIFVSATAEKIGDGPRTRHVLTSGNHHIEILEYTDARGRTKREGLVVSTLEAMRRLRGRKPLIQRDHGEGKRFVMSLSIGESFLRDDGTLCRIQKMAHDGRIWLRPHADATEAADRTNQITVNPNTLNGRKVTVTPTGRVLSAND